MAADAGVVEGCTGEGHLDQASPQACGGVGQVGFADPYADLRVTLSEGGGEAMTGLLRAVGQNADCQGGWAGCRGDPGGYLVRLP